MKYKYLAVVGAVLTATVALLSLFIFFESAIPGLSKPALAASLMPKGVPQSEVEPSPHAVAATHTVCPAGPPTCDYSVIQEAVDAAGDGDVIKVTTGTYTGVNVRPRDDFTTTGVVTQVIYISKTVTVQGGYTTTNWTTPNPEANPTILDANGQGRVFYITGDISPTVEGLRITGGDANVLPNTEWGSNHGGGMFIISATITIKGNWVYSNSATFGGGIAMLLSDNATLSENTVTTNTASFIGGGLVLDSCDNVMLTANSVAENDSVFSGGMHIYESDTNLIGNNFTANTAESGGGLTLIRNRSTLTSNLVSANIVSEFAGGVWLAGGTPTFVNNVIADNYAGVSGSGLGIEYSAPRFLHTTIARNSGGNCVQLKDDSTVTLTNTIVTSHTIGIAVQDGSTATLESTLWYANGTDYTGVNVVHTNDYTGDPAFAADGYHLTSSSAAINKGIDAGITSDIDGEPRLVDAGFDLGADEFWVYAYLPAIVKNYP